MENIPVSTNENGLKRNEKSIKRLDLQKVAYVTANKGIPIEQYIKVNYDILSKKVFCDVKELKFDLRMTLEKKVDLLWEMAFSFSDVTRPNWSGFMQTYRKGSYPGKSTCIYSTLLFVINQAVEISTEKSLKILCRLGGFIYFIYK